MDENRIAGTARNMGGKVEEGVGRAIGDTKTQFRGIADQAAGTAQDLYGQARDTAADAAVAARDSAASKVATFHYRDAALYHGHGRLRDRLVARSNASATLIESTSPPLC